MNHWCNDICGKDKTYICAGSPRKFSAHPKCCSFKNLNRSVSSLFCASVECVFSPFIFSSQVNVWATTLHIITFDHTLNVQSEFD